MHMRPLTSGDLLLPCATDTFSPPFPPATGVPHDDHHTSELYPPLHHLPIAGIGPSSSSSSATSIPPTPQALPPPKAPPFSPSTAAGSATRRDRWLGHHEHPAGGRHHHLPPPPSSLRCHPTRPLPSPTTRWPEQPRSPPPTLSAPSFASIAGEFDANLHLLRASMHHRHGRQRHLGQVGSATRAGSATTTVSARPHPHFPLRPTAATPTVRGPPPPPPMVARPAKSLPITLHSPRRALVPYHRAIPFDFAGGQSHFTAPRTADWPSSNPLSGNPHQPETTGPPSSFAIPARLPLPEDQLYRPPKYPANRLAEIAMSHRRRLPPKPPLRPIHSIPPPVAISDDMVVFTIMWMLLARLWNYFMC